MFEKHSRTNTIQSVTEKALHSDITKSNFVTVLLRRRLCILCLNMIMQLWRFVEKETYWQWPTIQDVYCGSFTEQNVHTILSHTIVMRCCLDLTLAAASIPRKIKSRESGWSGSPKHDNTNKSVIYSELAPEINCIGVKLGYISRMSWSSIFIALFSLLDFELALKHFVLLNLALVKPNEGYTITHKLKVL